MTDLTVQRSPRSIAGLRGETERNGMEERGEGIGGKIAS